MRLAVAVGRDHQVAEVGQRVGVGAVEGAGRDRDRGQLAGAGQRDGHPARGALDRGGGQLLLGGDELGLHLLRLLEHGLQVEAAARSGHSWAAEGVVRHLICSWSVGRRGSRCGQSWGISSITVAPSSRSSSSVLSRPLSSAAGSSRWASASGSGPGFGAGSSPRRVALMLDRAVATPARRLRRGRLVGLAVAAGSSSAVRSSSLAQPAVPGVWLGGRLGRQRGLRHRRTGHPRRRLRPRLRRGVDRDLDLPVGPDHVDRRLAQDLLAAAADERVAGTGRLEADGQAGRVHPDHLGVLAEQDPGEPPHLLDLLEQVGPDPAYVGQREHRPSGLLATGLRGCGRGCGAAGSAAALPAGSAACDGLARCGGRAAALAASGRGGVGRGAWLGLALRCAAGAGGVVRLRRWPSPARRGAAAGAAPATDTRRSSRSRRAPRPSES